jgi:uncharacterized protein GlcG (DUF336 family)
MVPIAQISQTTRPDAIVHPVRYNDEILLLGGGPPIKAGDELIGGIGVGGSPAVRMRPAPRRASTRSPLI